jgi:hypothetical protein
MTVEAIRLQLKVIENFPPDMRERYLKAIQEAIDAMALFVLERV